VFCASDSSACCRTRPVESLLLAGTSEQPRRVDSHQGSRSRRYGTSSHRQERPAREPQELSLAGLPIEALRWRPNLTGSLHVCRDPHTTHQAGGGNPSGHWVPLAAIGQSLSGCRTGLLRWTAVAAGGELAGEVEATLAGLFTSGSVAHPVRPANAPHLRSSRFARFPRVASGMQSMRNFVWMLLFVLAFGFVAGWVLAEPVLALRRATAVPPLLASPASVALRAARPIGSMLRPLA
jgi:hypothetical protein